VADHTEPNEATVEADETEAVSSHDPDRAATIKEEEEAEAARAAMSDEERKSVAAHEEEMMRIGAEAKGEGQIS
jgi:F0F1-type ATP synthase epsilon subunit